ncbi:MAG: hypothetical protein PF517_05745 [Salinivirgaceae bacterium]|jgi:hypothetical protein|nr:hypothetical protein [Salinivirgaceae bacterium]
MSVEIKNIIITAIYIIIPVLIIGSFIFFQSKRKEIFILLLSIISTSIILELMIRHYYPQISEHDAMFEYDSTLGWKFKNKKVGAIVYPGESHHFIQTNSDGFRDKDFVNNDTLKKIMFIGDSFVSNISVSHNNTFTELLQGKEKGIDILNMGVNGYSQVQEYLLMREWIPKIQPDLIVLMVYIRNDFDDNVDSTWIYSRPYISLNQACDTMKIVKTKNQSPRIIKTSAFKFFFHQKSHLYLFVRLRLKIAFRKYLQNRSISVLNDLGNAPELEFCRINYSTDMNNKFIIMEKLLTEISELAENEHIPILFALAPSNVQTCDSLWNSLMNSANIKPIEFDRQLPNKKLMAFAKKEGLIMLDLYSYLYAETQKGNQVYFAEEHHWNDLGNKTVANALFNYLKRTQYLKQISN